MGLRAEKLGLMAYCLLFSITPPRLSQHELESFSMKSVTKRCSILHPQPATKGRALVRRPQMLFVLPLEATSSEASFRFQVSLQKCSVVILEI